MSSAANHAKRSHRSHRNHETVCTGVRQHAYYKESAKSAGLLSLFRSRMMSKRRKVLEHRGAKVAAEAQ